MVVVDVQGCAISEVNPNPCCNHYVEIMCRLELSENTRGRCRSRNFGLARKERAVVSVICT